MKTKNDTINAIQTMVDSAVSKAGYDKTRNAMVIARNSNNTYEIEMDGIKYNNVVFYGSGVLQINEIVKVVIPNNQPSQMCILGKGVVENRKQGTVNGLNSNAFGFKTTASGSSSHAEGYNTTASGNYSHAEGYDTTASKSCSHAEGYNTEASGYYSHAEGRHTIASGYQSHAEGRETTASSSSSHAEGRETTASGDYSHAEGFQTTASGDFSHAEGDNTKASGMYQHVQGQYNVEDNNNTYADIVGNGEGNSARSNAYALDWRGDGHYKGDVYVGCKNDSSGGTRLIPFTKGVTSTSWKYTKYDDGTFEADRTYVTGSTTLTNATDGAYSYSNYTSISAPNLSSGGQPSTPTHVQATCRNGGRFVSAYISGTNINFKVYACASVSTAQTYTVDLHISGTW